jgi:hypothetical protein
MNEIKTEGPIFELAKPVLMQIFRGYAKKIGLLAKRGEPLSATVKTLYEHLYDHQNDPRADTAFRSAFRDWMKQHLEITSRVELAQKYGYLVEDTVELSSAPKIVTVQ